MHINIRKPATAMVLAFAALSAGVMASTPANAAAYTKSVYPPDRSGTTLMAWADLSLDCSGTYGCWNYMKIERNRWYGVECISGNWVGTNGWNSISTSVPYGCYNYRTTVDSYNDTVVTNSAGVNIGVVGVNSSNQTIYRYKRTWSSGWRQHCR